MNTTKHYREEFFTRHRDLIPQEAYDKRINVVGAGAIGSFVVLSLAKLGFRNIHVYDFDTIETENISSQFYPVDSIGEPKVAALARMVAGFTGIEIIPKNHKVDESVNLTGAFTICAVDSMAVRKELYENVVLSDWLIDPRMSAEYASINVLRMDSEETEHENYSRTLYSDGEAVQERCTAKTTMYTVLLIAGQVSKMVKDIVCEKPYVKTLDWDIASNTMMAFSSEGGKL